MSIISAHTNDFKHIYLLYSCLRYMCQNTNHVLGKRVISNPFTFEHLLLRCLVQLCMCKYSLAKAYWEMLNYLSLTICEKHSTGSSTCGSWVGTYSTLFSGKSILTVCSHSRMGSIRMEGCPVGHFREFIGMSCCIYGHATSTEAPKGHVYVRNHFVEYGHSNTVIQHISIRSVSSLSDRVGMAHAP